MKRVFSAMLTTAVFTTVLSAQAAVASHSKDIIVESPMDLPEAAQAVSEAMFLYDTGDGRSFLYLEQNDGQRLAILDVTDPAKIKAVGGVSIAATTSYDFVRDIAGSAELIRFRDNSGYATLDFRHAKKPVLIAAPAITNADNAESIGETGLLLNATATFVEPTRKAQDYRVIDTSSPSRSSLLAAVPEVKQRISKEDTGTLFLLSDNGLTAVRQPRVEQEHQVELLQQSNN
ncbi:MAG TPA: hypothetical protein VGM27_22595 [Acidobacteriaceae bacterium]